VVWTVDPVTREQGMRTLREFKKKADLTPDEYYLLGRLEFDQGRYIQAEGYFNAAARIRPGVPAEYFAAVVRVCLALNALGNAELALERLKTNHPRSWEAVREEARVLAHKIKIRALQPDREDIKKADIQKLREQALVVITKYPGWDSVANLASKSGPLLEELGLWDEAKKAYTKYLEQSDSPSKHGPLALFYIHRKEPEAAIRLAREHEKTAPVLLTARILTGAIGSKRADSATEARVEKWLDDALRAAAGNPQLEAGLLGTHAELLDAQGKYADAIKEYERAIAKHKSDSLVNNLCMLLALHDPKRADAAVKMMTDLIAIRGPRPNFLDTRAVAYLVSSRPEEAVKDLQMALVQFERPAYRFHLAWALDLDPVEGKRAKAGDELNLAKRFGLTAADLHAIEYKRYAELLAKHNIPLE
jgi:tetratricopeptide (TPR) repeat protein